VRSYVNVFVNADDIRARDGARTRLRSGDTILIVPSIAGGEEAPSSGGRREPGALDAQELRRYARHMALPEVGFEGQRRLKAAHVAVIGTGGLGSPVALYLAAAGVGTIGLIDFDDVDESNLQRQVLYAAGEVGRPKVEVAAARLRALNPHVHVREHRLRLTSENALAVLEPYDLVIDGADNFATRYLVNDACALLGKPYVYGAILKFEGQVAVFDAAHGPCYRCLFREPPPPGLVPSCAEAGVLGALPGIIGSLQALEALKLLLGVGESLVGRLIIFEGLTHRWRELKLRKDPSCPLCGPEPSIRHLIDYDAFCAGGADDTPLPAAAPATEESDAISVGELKARLDRGERPRLLDVREPFEWGIANLGEYGAKLLPMSELSQRADELADPESELIVYCRTGARSAHVVAALREAGYPRARNLEGGLHAWSREVDPRMPRY
jgi:sulfur-carrier protein adenylyltransferase/sulfurtransferase